MKFLPPKGSAWRGRGDPLMVGTGCTSCVRRTEFFISRQMVIFYDKVSRDRRMDAVCQFVHGIRLCRWHRRKAHEVGTRSDRRLSICAQSIQKLKQSAIDALEAAEQSNPSYCLEESVC